MARALITGVCGFIGSHLAQHLIDHGWTVDGLDHHLDTANIAAIAAQVGLLSSGMTIDGLADWQVSPGHYDAIFHLAGRVGPAMVMQDPLAMLSEHARHVTAVCELGARSGAAVMLASSSEVYQWNEDSVMREDAALTIGPSHLPRCGYAISKLNMEHVGLAYWRQRGVRVIITRFFNVVGARQRDGFVLPIFAKAALRGESLCVHGDGSQLRTFTHVRDAVEALRLLCAAPAAVGEIVNVAARQPCLSVATVAERVIAHVREEYDVRGESRIAYVGYEATGDLAWERMRVRRADVSKLHALTGLEFPDRWEAIVADVCADWAAQVGVTQRRPTPTGSP